MAPHSSTLAWKIAWVEEPGELPSMGSHRVGHDWSNSSTGILCLGFFFFLLFLLNSYYLSWVLFILWSLLMALLLKWIVSRYACEVKVKVTQSCPTLCDLPGILQARILEWVAFPLSRGSSQPRDWTQISYIAGGLFASWATREVQENWSR